MPVSHWGFLRQHQLTQLIKKLLTSLGFKLFSSGIRQWVYVNTINATYRTISFPIAFPNGVFICTANFCGYAEDATDACVIWNDGQTTRSMVQFRINGSTNSSPKCIAIGH